MPNPFFVWLGTTIGGIVLFLMLIRRRPHDAPSLATFVIEGFAPAAAQAVMPDPAVSLPPPPNDSGPASAVAPLRQNRGRKKRPVVAATTGVASSSAFAKPPAKGVERVFVSYQGVPMVAEPGQIQPMVARLERGNEIEIIGSHEGHLNVRTPAGLTGWIPRVTVSDVRPPAPAGPTPSSA